MKKRSKFGWLEFILGLLLIGLSILTIVNPGAALTGLVVIYSAAAVISGIADIVFYVQLRNHTGFGPTTSLVSGIVSALVGLLLLLNPVLGKWIASIAFPVWFIVRSISRLANWRFIRDITGKGMSVFSIVLSALGILLGVLLLINPAVSALSLGYLISLGLMVYGVSSIVEAFSGLGARQDDGQEIV